MVRLLHEDRVLRWTGGRWFNEMETYICRGLSLEPDNEWPLGRPNPNRRLRKSFARPLRLR